MPKTPNPRVLDSSCGTRAAIELISPKWRTLIMCALTDGEYRYNGLLRKIEDISPKMLTQTLRGMERDGLVERRTDSSAPKNREYSLTRLGKTLQARLAPLCKWAEANKTTLIATRKPWTGNRRQTGRN